MEPEPSEDAPTNIASPAGEGHVRDVAGARQLWKIRAGQTNGVLVCIETVVPPGSAIPVHRLSGEDETFYVVSGTAAFIGDDGEKGAVTLGPGGTFFGARGHFHGCRNAGSEPLRLFVTVTPGASIDALFSELEDVAHTQGRPLDAARIVEVSARYGVSFPLS